MRLSLNFTDIPRSPSSPNLLRMGQYTDWAFQYNTPGHLPNIFRGTGTRGTGAVEGIADVVLFLEGKGAGRAPGAGGRRATGTRFDGLRTAEDEEEEGWPQEAQEAQKDRLVVWTAGHAVLAFVTFVLFVANC